MSQWVIDQIGRIDAEAQRGELLMSRAEAATPAMFDRLRKAVKADTATYNTLARGTVTDRVSHPNGHLFQRAQFPRLELLLTLGKTNRISIDLEFQESSSLSSERSTREVVILSGPGQDELYYVLEGRKHATAEEVSKAILQNILR